MNKIEELAKDLEAVLRLVKKFAAEPENGWHVTLADALRAIAKEMEDAHAKARKEEAWP